MFAWRSFFIGMTIGWVVFGWPTYYFVYTVLALFSPEKPTIWEVVRGPILNVFVLALAGMTGVALGLVDGHKARSRLRKHEANAPSIDISS